MDSEIKEKVKNFGCIVGMIQSVQEPENKKILWYDETISEGCPIKYYNLTSKTWKLITEP